MSNSFCPRPWMSVSLLSRLQNKAEHPDGLLVLLLHPLREAGLHGEMCIPWHRGCCPHPAHRQPLLRRWSGKRGEDRTSPSQHRPMCPAPIPPQGEVIPDPCIPGAVCMEALFRVICASAVGVFWLC